jgi:hypothetical protein
MVEMPHRAGWTHPSVDPTLALDRMGSQDMDDPRAVPAQGPCGDAHCKQFSLKMLSSKTHDENMKFGGNAHARWGECNRCALRLFYLPKKDKVGKYCIRFPIPVTEMALKLAKEQGVWETMEAAIFSQFLAIAEAQIRIDGWKAMQKDANSSSSGTKPKSTPRPKASQPPRPSRRSSSSRRNNRPATEDEEEWEQEATGQTYEEYER